jgi:solute carrier family 41
MREVDQLIIIIPTVLNLNGNLEMNLSSRLGTASNVGELDDPVIRRSILIGSLALLQVQTISVSFVAACIALILGKFVPMTKSPRLRSTEGSIPLLGRTVKQILDLRDEPPIGSNSGRKSGIPTYVFPASESFESLVLIKLLLTA